MVHIFRSESTHIVVTASCYALFSIGVEECVIMSQPKHWCGGQLCKYNINSRLRVAAAM